MRRLNNSCHTDPSEAWWINIKKIITNIKFFFNFVACIVSEIVK